MLQQINSTKTKGFLTIIMSDQPKDRKKGKKEVWNRDPKYKPSYYGKAPSLVPPSCIKQTLLHANMTEQRLLEARRELIQSQRSWSYKLLRLQQKAFIIRQLLQQEILRVKGIQATLLLPDIVIQAHKYIADTELRKVNYLGAKHLPMHGRMNVYELQKYKEDLLQVNTKDESSEGSQPHTQKSEQVNPKSGGKNTPVRRSRDGRNSNNTGQSMRTERASTQYKSRSDTELTLPYLYTPQACKVKTPEKDQHTHHGFRDPTNIHTNQLQTQPQMPYSHLVDHKTSEYHRKHQVSVVISPAKISTQDDNQLPPSKENKQCHQECTSFKERSLSSVPNQGSSLSFRSPSQRITKHVTISEYPSSSSMKQKDKHISRQNTLSVKLPDQRFVDLHSSLTLSPQGSHDGFSMLSPASWNDDSLTAEDQEKIRKKYLSLNKGRLDSQKIHSALEAVHTKTHQN